MSVPGKNIRSEDYYIGEQPPVRTPRMRLPFIVILAVIVIGAGGYYLFQHLKFARSPKTVIVSDTIPLKIYYPVSPYKLGTKEIAVKTVLTDKEKAEAIMTGLKQSNIIPSTVTLLDFTSDPEGTLILNLSPDAVSLPLNPLTEIQTVYSIVNTFLANFQKARSIQLLAGGEAFYTPGGTLYTYKPLEFNSHILED